MINRVSYLKLSTFGSWFLISSSSTPSQEQYPIAFLETAREKLTKMEGNGMIFKEEEHTPWSTSTSKNNVRICIDPRDLTKALKRPHYPIVTVVAWEQAHLCEFGENQFGGILGDPGVVSRAGLKGATNVFKHGWKSPWVPTLTGPFPNGQENAGSWLGTKNALYYCAQSANSFSWVLFVSSYTTAIISPQLPGSFTKLS